MKVNAILLSVLLILGIIVMIMEIVEIARSWKKEKERIRREDELSLRLRTMRVTIDDLRKGHGLPPIGEEENNEPNT